VCSPFTYVNPRVTKRFKIETVILNNSATISEIIKNFKAHESVNDKFERWGEKRITTVKLKSDKNRTLQLYRAINKPVNDIIKSNRNSSHQDK
jgi:hypothetical protein